MTTPIIHRLKGTTMNPGTKVWIITLLVLFIAGAAFAGDKISPDFKGIENFRRAFPQATSVVSEVKQKFTVVSFTWNNIKLQAFYDRQGNHIGTTRTIAVNDLPLAYQVNIRNEYPDYVITEAIEFDHPVDGLNYYVTVEGKQKSYVLQISTEGAISVFKKMKN